MWSLRAITVAKKKEKKKKIKSQKEENTVIFQIVKSGNCYSFQPPEI